MYIIFGNMGNESIALIQWAKKQQITNVVVIYVKTGWAGSQWHKRYALAEQLALKYGFKCIELAANPDFVKLMRERNAFPTTKFQWCAGFLKGLPLLAWLDEYDAEAEATMILGLYRNMSRAQAKLPEYVDDSEHFGERRVWHPFYQYDIEQIKSLVVETGIEWLEHRALECQPCVNCTIADFQQIDKTDIDKTVTLEQELGQQMFAQLKSGDNSIEDIVQWAQQQSEQDCQKSAEQFDMGCGSSYGCGT